MNQLPLFAARVVPVTDWTALGLWMVGEGPRPVLPAPVAGVEARGPACPCVGRWAGPRGSWWLVGRPVRACRVHGGGG